MKPKSVTGTVETFEFGVQVKMHQASDCRMINDKPKTEDGGHGQHCDSRSFLCSSELVSFLLRCCYLAAQNVMGIFCHSYLTDFCE